MRLLQKLLRKPSIAPGIVAISFFPHGFSLAICRYMDGTRPHLTHCEFVAANERQLTGQLTALVKNYALEDYECHILLTRDQYRSSSIEAPPVPAEELKQAVIWRIADMLEYPVDQAVIDHYRLPKSNRANAPEMLEVVTCPASVINSLIEHCREAALNVTVIDIQETTLRNLATLLPENSQGVAVLHLQANSGLIMIQKGGAIYLSRKLEQGYANLSTAFSGSESLNLEQDQNNLALEIQRSLDYVEHFYDIPPVNSLAVVLMPNDAYNLINFLNINFGITARAMDLSAIIESDILLNDTLQNICTPCIGASLRRYMDSAR